MITKNNFWMFYLLMGLMIIILIIIPHEIAHIEIYSYYGLDSKVSFKDFPIRITVIPETNCPNGACDIANNLNDIMAYLEISVLIIGFIILGILYYNYLLKESKKNEKL